jgi:hypothetical protein
MAFLSLYTVPSGHHYHPSDRDKSRQSQTDLARKGALAMNEHCQSVRLCHGAWNCPDCERVIEWFSTRTFENRWTQSLMPTSAGRKEVTPNGTHPALHSEFTSQSSVCSSCGLWRLGNGIGHSMLESSL